MARAINRGYIDRKMTAYINWPLIASIYDDLPYNTVGLMVANQPWSGNYNVGKQLCVTARPYHAVYCARLALYRWSHCYLSGNDSNGSYVALKSTNGSDYSVIIETVDASASQAAQISSGN